MSEYSVTYQNAGYEGPTTSTSTDRTTNINPTSTGFVKRSQTKTSMTSFNVVNLILIAGVITSITLLTVVLVQLSQHLADGHDDSILNSITMVMNQTADIQREVAILRDENEKMKQALLSLEEKNKNNLTKIDLILRETQTIQKEFNEYYATHDCPLYGFIGTDGICYFAIMNIYRDYAQVEKACRQLNSFPAYVESDLTYSELDGYLRPRVAIAGMPGAGFWLGEIYDVNSGKIYLMDGRENTWEPQWRSGFPVSNQEFTQLMIYVDQDPGSSLNGLMNRPPSEDWYVLCQRP